MEKSKVNTLKALAPLQLAFRKDLAEDQFDFYVQMLVDIDPEYIDKAVKKLIYTSKYLPSIAEIRDTALSIKKTEAGTQEPDSGAAWGEVQRQIRATGYCGKPKFTSPLIAEAVERMGWKDICCTPVEDTGILRAQFRRVYEELVEIHKDEEVNVFIGVLKTSNHKQIESNIQMLTDKMGM